MKVRLSEMPVGIRFRVIDGMWTGRVLNASLPGTSINKVIFVEETNTVYTFDSNDTVEISNDFKKIVVDSSKENDTECESDTNSELVGLLDQFSDMCKSLDEDGVETIVKAIGIVLNGDKK